MVEIHTDKVKSLIETLCKEKVPNVDIIYAHVNATQIAHDIVKEVSSNLQNEFGTNGRWKFIVNSTVIQNSDAGITSSTSMVVDKLRDGMTTCRFDATHFSIIVNVYWIGY